VYCTLDHCEKTYMENIVIMGKGSTPRKANHKKFMDNFDKIFNKKLTKGTECEHRTREDERLAKRRQTSLAYYVSSVGSSDNKIRD